MVLFWVYSEKSKKCVKNSNNSIYTIMKIQFTKCVVYI